MASSATGLSDLNKSGRPSKKKVTDGNDQCVGGELTMTNQGTKTLNLDPKLDLGASSGDIDHTAAGQEQEKGGKKTRKEICADYNNKRKMKLEHYEKILPEFEKLKRKYKLLLKNNMLLRKNSESTNQQMEELRSQVSSLISGHISQTKETNSLVLELLKEQKEKDELKREIEHLKNLIAQLDSSFSGQNIHGHSQPIPTSGGGSVSYIIPQQQHVNSTFSGQFMNGSSQPMQTGGEESAYPFISQEKAMGFSIDLSELLLSPPPMETGGGEAYLTSGN